MIDQRWHLVSSGRDITEYLEIPGGRLYRTVVWNDDDENASPAVAMIFVPKNVAAEAEWEESLKEQEQLTRQQAGPSDVDIPF